MKRSPIWIAAYAAAWGELRGLRVFAPGPPTAAVADQGEPMAPAEIAQRCAARATMCEAGYVAAFGELDEDNEEDGARDRKDA